MRFPTPIPTILAVALLPHAAAQSSLALHDSAVDEQLGWHLANAGDLDGDGTDDLFVGAPFFRPSGFAVRPGRAAVWSGASLVNATPTVILDLDGPTAMIGCAGAPGLGSFGAHGDGGRDVTGDGVPDIVVSGYVSGNVRAFDGATGAPIATAGQGLDGNCLQQHGFHTRLFNADGDGFADLLVTRPTLATPPNDIGRYRVYSGAWMANPAGGAPNILHQGRSTVDGDGFGYATAILPDLDGDGAEEFVVGASLPAPGWPNGAVEVRSGATGQLVLRFGPDAAVTSVRYGTRLTNCGDFDGDGTDDLAVVDTGWALAQDPTNRLGRLEVVSGAWIGGAAVPRTLFVFEGRDVGTNPEFGRTLTSTDANGDGTPDFVLGRRRGGFVGWSLVSGRTGNIVWDVDSPQTDAIGTPNPAVRLGSPTGDLLALGSPYAVGASGGDGVIQVIRPHDATGTIAVLGIGCPCGNDDPNAGCANLTGRGAFLAPELGSASFADARLGMVATDLPPNSFGFLAGGMLTTAPSTIGNGLISLNSPIRLPAMLSDGNGRARIIGDLFGDLTALAPITGATPPMVGVPFAFQFVYRDQPCAPGVPPINFTNVALIVPRL
ncbi:MAG: hypothetical protein AAF726_21050 [Planctomycetota bacterium]